MNCLIYLRVSTKEQAQTNETEGYSIAAQRKAALGYKSPAEYERMLAVAPLEAIG